MVNLLSMSLILMNFLLFQYFISRMSGLLRGKAVRASDKRISLMTEIITYMKTIKMNAWEDWFDDRISCMYHAMLILIFFPPKFYFCAAFTDLLIIIDCSRC